MSVTLDWLRDQFNPDPAREAAPPIELMNEGVRRFLVREQIRPVWLLDIGVVD
jgi:hypothetical protein